ncbi:MAG: 4'-phosphopantetheinyl transferase superfamily protein [Actinomycetota bacterium]
MTTASAFEWCIAERAEVSLDDDTVHLWCCRHDTVAVAAAVDERSLSADEVRRADRFVFEQDRRRFVEARLFLRSVLADHCSCAPGDIEFELGSTGKPDLVSTVGAPAVAFNVTHSKSWSLVACSAGSPVGVDIERVRPFPELSDVAAKVLSARELAMMLVLPPGEQLGVFFRLWTRKEAASKVFGAGLSDDLIAVELPPLVPRARQPVWSGAIRVDHRACTMIDFDFDADHVAALVVGGECRAVRFHPPSVR